MCAGRACGGGHRRGTQDKWTIQCVKFSMAGAQGTHGGGRAERAATETGRKRPSALHVRGGLPGSAVPTWSHFLPPFLN